jgi:hypothetical protein
MLRELAHQGQVRGVDACLDVATTVLLHHGINLRSRSVCDCML